MRPSTKLLLVAFVSAICLLMPARAGKCPSNETEIIYRGDGRRLPGVYEKLISCSNITSLDLDLGAEGCVVFSDPYRFLFTDGDRLPDLRKLSLERYDLTGTRGRRWEIEASWKLWAQQKVVDVLRFTGLGKDTVTAWDETNLEKWTRAMDFGKLQELTLALLDQDEALFYDRMKGELPSLQSLSLRWSPSTDTPAPQNHIDFLRSVPPLRQLSISVRSPCSESVQRLAFPLPDILDRHCRSLESLTLKQWEGDVPGKRRPMLSTEEITSIRDACPNLSSLELDIDRTAETGWPLATFDALTEFKNVTNLTLRFELGSDMHRGHFTRPWSQSPPDDACREPNMNRTAAEALFAYLGERKAGKPLERVVFELGDYPDKGYMGPLYLPGWEEGRAKKFICEARGQAAADEGRRFGLCEVVDEDDFYRWDDELPVQAAGMGDMWSFKEERIVREYLAGLTGER